MNDEPTINQKILYKTDNSLSATPAPIKIGDTLHNLYQVKDRVSAGGMGDVYQVYHKEWKVDMAMKWPKETFFQTEQQKEYYKRECNHWIELGLHPNIVSCFYVREIQGVPSIFAEWMDGGSLTDWIYPKEDEEDPTNPKIDDQYTGDKKQGGKLYEVSDEKDEKEVLKRIVSISIQFARGLNYAHQYNPQKILIHKDVKPSNLLLTVDGSAKFLTAKVADFGIANAIASAADIGTDVDRNYTDDRSIKRNNSTYSSSYCSPEQAKGIELTLRTDVWSWAVSVLEMFVGYRPWDNPYTEGGVIAGMECEYYFSLAMIPIPEAMKDLLRWCFKYNEADRPKDFGAVVTELLKIYRAETGIAYPLPEPRAASLMADSLNNRALSYLDLGMPEKAEEYWERALEIDPGHGDSFYNRCIHLWKNGKISQREIITMLGESSFAASDYYIAKTYLVKGEAENAVVHLNKAEKILGENNDNVKETRKTIHDIIEKGTGARLISTFKGDGSDINSVCFSRNGKKILSGSKDGTVNLWDVVSGDCINIFSYKSEKEYDKTSVPASFGNFEHWDVKTFARLIEMGMLPADSMTNLDTKVLLGLGNVCVFGSNEDGVLNYKALTDIKNTGVTSVCFNNDGTKIAIGCDNGTVIILETLTGNTLKSFSCRSCPISYLSFSDNNTHIRAASYNKNNTEETGVWLFDLSDQKNNVEVLFDDVTAAIAFASDNIFIRASRKTSIYYDEEVEIQGWNIYSGKKIDSYNMDVSLLGFHFNDDGTKAISNPPNDSIIVWDLQTGIKSSPLEEPIKALMENVTTSAISHDNNKIVTGNCAINREHEIKIFNVKTGVCEQVYNAHDNFINIVRFSPDGKMVLSANYGNGDIKLWRVPDEWRYEFILTRIHTADDAIKNKEKFELLDEKFNNHIKNKQIQQALDVLAEMKEIPLFGSGTEYNNAKRKVACFCKSNRLLNAQPHVERTGLPNAHFMPDSKNIMVCKDMKLNLWNIENKKFFRSYSTERSVNDNILYYFDSTGEKFLSESYSNSPGGPKRTISVWDTESGECIRKISKSQDVLRPSHLSFSPDGTKILFKNTTGKSWKSGNIILLNAETMQYFNKFDFICQRYRHTLRFHPNGQKIAAVIYHNDKTAVAIIDIFTGKCLSMLPEEPGNFSEVSGAILSICFSPNGEWLLVGGSDKKAKIWSFAEQKYIQVFECHDSITSVCFSPDGTKILTGFHEDTILKLWDVLTGECIYNFEGFTADPLSISFSPNGRYIVSSTWHEFTVWDLDWELEFPDWQDWHETVRPYLNIFLTLHPNWSNDDFDFDNILIPDLQNRGYGWLRPEGVRAELIMTHKGNLAETYLAKKKYTKAIELYEQVISWREKSLYATKKDKLIAFQNAANAYFKRRDYKNARRRFEDAVSLCPLAKEDAMHEAHFYDDFAMLCFDAKEFSEAIRWRKAACNIRESYCSDDDERAMVAQEYTKLGKLAYLVGFYQTASESYQTAYELLRWVNFKLGSSTKEVRELLKKALKANKKAKKYPESVFKKRIYLRYYLHRFLFDPLLAFLERKVKHFFQYLRYYLHRFLFALLKRGVKYLFRKFMKRQEKK